MTLFTIRVPDIGEGVAEAELAEWNVAVGDIIREDDIFAAVMTDKATVEIPSSVDGKVVWLGAEVGDTVAIGADLIRLEIDGNADDVPDKEPEKEISPEKVEDRSADPQPSVTARSTVRPEPATRTVGAKPLASPSVRLRAKENGVDLRFVEGNGKAGNVTHDDLDEYLTAENTATARFGGKPDNTVEKIKITGLRRKIAERMSLSKSRIPHITIVEEIDVTALEELRAQLNEEKSPDRPKLTVLPFIMGAMVKALHQQPQLNAHFDDENGVVLQHGGVHIGVASQTPNGLMVPVVRHCESRSIWDTASEMIRVSDAAKSGSASREELSGSTITITSLGPLGAIATTPIINHPEVAIVGVNRMAVRPMWNGNEFIPRKMMNLSSSFDHRVIDGWDAAVFVKRLKTLLETPAMIFVQE